jgi:hypothetical protein
MKKNQIIFAHFETFIFITFKSKLEQATRPSHYKKRQAGRAKYFEI